MKVLETPRLILRPWRTDDLEDLYSYAKVKGVGEMAGWPHHKNRGESRKILNIFVDAPLESAVVFKETGRVIGSAGLRQKETDQWEIGYVLSKEYWGRGLMPEAVTELLRCLFEEMAAQTVWCSHFAENDRSRRVIEKCGFHFSKSEMYYTPQGKELCSKTYCITREEYFKEKKHFVDKNIFK